MIEDIRNTVANFISPSVLWAVLGAIVLVFAVVSVALMYHWKNYNVDSKVVSRITRVYFFVSFTFILAMAAAITSYSL